MTAVPGRRTAYTAEWVLPVSSAPIRDGVVVVDGARIAFVGPAEASRTGWEDAHEVALGRAILMPGLVNAHTHLELTALRGFLEGFAFRDWLATLTAVRRELLDDDTMLDASRAGIAEGLRAGITTYADTASTTAPLRAMREAGVRGIGYVETFGPDPRQASASIARVRATVDAERAHDGALVRAGVSPHAPYTVSAPLFREVAAYARHDDLPVAVHVAESMAETRFVVEATGPFADGLRARGIAVTPQGASPVALLEATGLLAARPLLIHAVQVNARDMAMMQEHGATVVHCPVSNAKLGHGIAPVDELHAFGVPVGLGSDSVASNDRMHLVEEARQATLLQSLRRGVPDALSAHDALAMATRGGASALGLADRVGTLEAGKDADLAAFGLDGPDASPACAVVHDPAVVLVHVLGGAARARLVTVAGRVLVRDGQPVRDSGGSPQARDDAALDARMVTLGARLARWRAH